MRLIDADRLLRRIERAKNNENELDDDIVTIILDMPTENVEEDETEVSDSYGVEVYAFADKLKSKLKDSMTSEEIISLIDSLLK